MVNLRIIFRCSLSRGLIKNPSDKNLQSKESKVGIPDLSISFSFISLFVIGLALTFSNSLLVAQTDLILEEYHDTAPISLKKEKNSKEYYETSLPIIEEGGYKKKQNNGRQILAYDHVREADVSWAKRLWQVIDLRNEVNLLFSDPLKPFVYVLLDIIERNPSIKVYEDDSFTSTLSYSDVEANLALIDTIETTNFKTMNNESIVVHNDFDWGMVKKIRIMEDWYFDIVSSSLKVRILGIAPVREVYDQEGNFRGEQAMFWLYYPECRKEFVKYDVFHPYAQDAQLTWEDVWELRLFEPLVWKETNFRDEAIQEYAVGETALKEARAIRNKIFEYEQFLWQY